MARFKVVNPEDRTALRDLLKHQAGCPQCTAWALTDKPIYGNGCLTGWQLYHFALNGVDPVQK
jgi:hypothetical protein